MRQLLVEVCVSKRKILASCVENLPPNERCFGFRGGKVDELQEPPMQPCRHAHSSSAFVAMRLEP